MFIEFCGPKDVEVQLAEVLSPVDFSKPVYNLHYGMKAEFLAKVRTSYISQEEKEDVYRVWYGEVAVVKFFDWDFHDHVKKNMDPDAKEEDFECIALYNRYGLCVQPIGQVYLRLDSFCTNRECACQISNVEGMDLTYVLKKGMERRKKHFEKYSQPSEPLSIMDIIRMMT